MRKPCVCKRRFRSQVLLAVVKLPQSIVTATRLEVLPRNSRNFLSNVRSPSWKLQRPTEVLQHCDSCCGLTCKASVELQRTARGVSSHLCRTRAPAATWCGNERFFFPRGKMLEEVGFPTGVQPMISLWR